VKAQGFGANTDEEMDQYGKNDMRALSEMLGNKVITALGAPSLAWTSILIVSDGAVRPYA
jgi:hypothetical protein